MDTLTGLYILLQLDAIKHFIDGIIFLLMITILFAVVILMVVSSVHETTEYLKKFSKPIIISTALAFLLSLINTLIPTTERAALMVVGAKAIDSNTTTILSNIPEKYAKILEQKADAYIKELEKTE